MKIQDCKPGMRVRCTEPSFAEFGKTVTIKEVKAYCFTVIEDGAPRMPIHYKLCFPALDLSSAPPGLCWHHANHPKKEFAHVMSWGNGFIAVDVNGVLHEYSNAEPLPEYRAFTFQEFLKWPHNTERLTLKEFPNPTAIYSVSEAGIKMMEYGPVMSWNSLLKQAKTEFGKTMGVAL